MFLHVWFCLFQTERYYLSLLLLRLLFSPFTLCTPQKSIHAGLNEIWNLYTGGQDRIPWGFFFSWSLLCLSHVFNWMIFNAVIWNTTIPQHQVVFDSQLSWDVEVWLELCGVRMPGQRVRQTETELRWRRTDELIGCDRSSVLLHCSTKCPKWKSIWHNAGSRPSWPGRDEWTVETLAKLTLLQQYACKQSWYSCDDMMLTIKTPSWAGSIVITDLPFSSHSVWNAV